MQNLAMLVSIINTNKQALASIGCTKTGYHKPLAITRSELYSLIAQSLLNNFLLIKFYSLYLRAHHMKHLSIYFYLPEVSCQQQSHNTSETCLCKFMLSVAFLGGHDCLLKLC